MNSDDNPGWRGTIGEPDNPSLDQVVASTAPPNSRCHCVCEERREL